MIAWIVFIMWTIFGPCMFIKVNNMNDHINPLKMNLLILISGPILWIIKIFCFVKKSIVFLYKTLNNLFVNIGLWFGK